MQLTGEFVELKFHYKNNKYSKKQSILSAKNIYILNKCDKCGIVAKENTLVFNYRLSLINLEYCGKCSRPLMASIASKKGQLNEDGTKKPNAGKFSTINWNKLSKEQQFEKTSKAAKALYSKLNSNPELKNEHYKKVFKNSSIGYISKGQSEIYDILKNDGYVLDGLVGGVKVDIVNFDKKIAIEYNGDMWHCNPRIWKAETYNNAIKMTAQEKWNSDRNRRFYLRKLGYDVHVIWEFDWSKNRTKIYNLLNKLNDDKYTFEKWEYKESKPLKGRTYEDLYGIEKAKILKENISNRQKLKRKNPLCIWQATLPNNDIIYLHRKKDYHIKKIGIIFKKIPKTEDLIIWNGIIKNKNETFKNQSI